jgi:hypothetical protein
MSRADHGVGRAVLDLTAGHLNGGVFLAAQNIRGFFIHVHHIIGLHHGIMHAVKVELFQLGLQLGRVAHKLDVQVVALCGVNGARYHHGGAEIPPHGVHGDDGALVHYSLPAPLATT